MDGESLHQLPVELQAEVEGVGGDIQGLRQSVSALKLPSGPDLEEIHMAVDTCRVGCVGV